MKVNEDNKKQQKKTLGINLLGVITKLKKCQVLYLLD